MDKKGSITLEAAISFTVTITFIAGIISVISFYKTDIQMKRSLAQACEEASLICPLSTTASDYISTVVNAFPDLGIGDTKAMSVVSTVAKIATGVDIASDFAFEDYLTEAVFAGTMARNIRECFIERNSGSEFMCPDDIDVTMRLSEGHNVLEVTCDYSVVTLAGRIDRSCYNIIPVYGDFSTFLNAAEGASSSGDDIWSEDNFSRGEDFREIYGCNLPKKFPTIDDYTMGQATSLVSMDLTAPTYQSGENISETITEHIDKLASFTGGDYSVEGSDYHIGAITGRTLVVVIPDNSSEYGRSVLESSMLYAASRGVDMRVETYGNSNKYN
ncbi:MAG: hypothetical protein K5745_03425 [Saccharofermentans sp.]|nr:hypothetical protein [Saccharofermentans sp.]